MNWLEGLKAARKEYEGHADDLGVALMLFAADPPDTPFQRGYRAGLRSLARKHCPKIEALLAPHLVD